MNSNYSANSNNPRMAPLDRSHLSAYLRRLIDFFEHLTDETAREIDQFYVTQAYFKDPFNEVNSVIEIRRIFQDMFVHVINPRFVVHTAIEQNKQVFIAWDFLFEMHRFKKGETQCVRGSSHLQFNEDGKVVFHRDYWDAAEELYEKIPMLGGLMRMIKKRAA